MTPRLQAASAFDAVGADSQVVPGGLVPRRTEMGRVLDDFHGKGGFHGRTHVDFMGNMEKHGGFCPIYGENMVKLVYFSLVKKSLLLNITMLYHGNRGNLRTFHGLRWLQDTPIG